MGGVFPSENKYIPRFIRTHWHLGGKVGVFGFAAARLVGRRVVFGFAVARIGILVGRRAVFGLAAKQGFRFSVCVLRVVLSCAAELDLESSFHAS